MTPLRLLVCSDAFLPAHEEGGPPFSTFNLCRAMAAAGADVRVVTTDRDGRSRLAVPVDRWTEFEGVPVWYARSLPGPYYPARTAARAIAGLGDRDAILGSGTLWTHLGLLGWRASRRTGAPGIVMPRGLLDPWAFAHKGLRKRVYWQFAGRGIVADAAAVVALNGNERDAIQALGTARRVEVIPNGVDVEAFATPPPAEALAEAAPALAGRPFVLFLGRVHEKKGVQVLLRAIEEPALVDREFAVVVAGPVDEAFRPALDRLRAAASSPGRLVFTGPVAGQRKAALLAHARAFVLPSASEGLPMAALEALASGCPVVLTPACGLPEAADAGAGLEVPARPAEVAAALARLLGDEALARDMGRRGRRLAAERFGRDAVGHRMLALCRELARPGA